MTAGSSIVASNSIRPAQRGQHRTGCRPGRALRGLDMEDFGIGESVAAAGMVTWPPWTRRLTHRWPVDAALPEPLTF
jgi:hypothetical protein